MLNSYRAGAHSNLVTLGVSALFSGLHPSPPGGGLHRYTLHEGTPGLNPSTCRGYSRASPLTSQRGLQGSIPPHAEGTPLQGFTARLPEGTAALHLHEGTPDASPLSYQRRLQHYTLQEGTPGSHLSPPGGNSSVSPSMKGLQDFFFTLVSQLGKYPNGGFYSGRKLSAFTVVCEYVKKRAFSALGEFTMSFLAYSLYARRRKSGLFLINTKQF